MIPGLKELDLANNYSREIELLFGKAHRCFSIFYIDGHFGRIGTDSRRGRQFHADYPDCLVGVYRRDPVTAETPDTMRRIIKGDIDLHRKQVAASCKRRTANG